MTKFKKVKRRQLKKLNFFPTLLRFRGTRLLRMRRNIQVGLSFNKFRKRRIFTRNMVKDYRGAFFYHVLDQALKTSLTNVISNMTVRFFWLVSSRKYNR